MPPWSRLAATLLVVLTVVASAGVGLSRAQTTRSGVAVADAQYRMTSWQQLVQQRQLGTWEKLVAVNDFFNQFTQQDDAVTWGLDDHWATLEELLLVGAGDCEDFAGAKYATLVAMGVPRSQLDLAIVRAFSPRTRRIERHMVLIYEDADTGVRWVLDNLSARISRLNARPDLAVLGLVDVLTPTRTALRASVAWVALFD